MAAAGGAGGGRVGVRAIFAVDADVEGAVGVAVGVCGTAGGAFLGDPVAGFIGAAGDGVEGEAGDVYAGGGLEWGLVRGLGWGLVRGFVG